MTDSTQNAAPRQASRGDALEWGIQIDSDGKVFTVTQAGAQRADWKFGNIEDLIDWLREENEGLLIKRMARGKPHA